MGTGQSQGTTLTLPVQFCYLLLYGLGVAAALVQRGHPTLVFGVLGALLPLALLARVPRRWFPGWVRQVLQVLIAGAGVAWWHLQPGGQAVDVVLVESAAVLGVALAVGGVAREYGLMGFISLVLLGYGGVMPGRSVYLPALGIYLFVGILLMYETRTLNLVAGHAPAPTPTAMPRHTANWAYRLAHLALAGGFMVLLISAFPLPQGRSIGLIPVGFASTQDLLFPSLWRQWLQPATELFSKGDDKTRQTVESKASTDADPLQDPNAAKNVAVAKPAPTLDAREGNGGAGVGTDLVMRVQSPVKLYWLAQLYDVYDGSSWRVSAALRAGESGLDKRAGTGIRSVDQHISIEKAGSLRLPGAYRVNRCLWDDAQTSIDADGVLGALVRLDTAGAFLHGTPPALPWQYRCTSSVPTLDAHVQLAPGASLAHQGWQYRQLPEALISDRLRRLAESVTEGCETPMEQAMALQEHLRQHYTYTLAPPAVPATSEPVDHFLFESRRGYCQHFAQAFTVLARLAGLPARLAAGYSPGTQNLLANTFDVYEYHAHAWTQIFIEPYGWLTFDGVAPGNLRLEAGPSFLRRLMDPFGEEWNARPPELSLRASAPPPAAPGDPAQTAARNPAAKALEAVYTRAVLDSKTVRPESRALILAAAATARDWLAGQWGLYKARLGQWGGHAWAQLQSGLRWGLAFLRGLSAAAYAVAGVLLMVLLVLWRRRRWLLAVGATAAARWHCRRRWRRVLRRGERDPEATIEACQEVLVQVLALGHFRRPGNLDALEYAGWLERSEPRLGGDYRVVADVRCRMLYRDTRPERAEADLVLAAVGSIRAQVLERLTLSGRRRRG
jgi:transglutaminase-like putative cysteine protease